MAKTDLKPGFLDNSMPPTLMHSSSSPGEALLKGSSFRNLGILALLAIVTRVPFMGIGEPDSALFVTGVRQWFRGGPHNLCIYSAQVCAAYYATMAALLALTHLGERDCVLMMSAISVIAGIGILAFGYLVGLRFVSEQTALAAMLLFCFSPGLWWITTEPHPQASSIFFGLAAVWCFCRYLESTRRLFAMLAIGFFAIAIAVKVDAVLMFPAFLALTFRIRRTWLNLLWTILTISCSFVAALAMDRLIIGSSSQSLRAGEQAVNTFARIPSLLDAVRQVVPIPFGIGVVTTIAITIGIFILIARKNNHRTTELALWSIPGYAFWFCIAGNNARHVVFFGIPLFWLGAEYLRMRYVVASILTSLLIPGSTNMGMLPSPNVPASARLLAQKKKDIDGAGHVLAKRSFCFVGSYTNDYLVDVLLDHGGKIQAQASATDASASEIIMPSGTFASFRRINPHDKFQNLGACASLEYDPSGRKVRFLGGEWHIPII